jgi:predicted aspartyl protease
LVDTGSTYTSVPRPLLDALGVEPHERAWFRLADGHHVQREIGRTWVRVGERAELTLVVFAEPGSPALLGAYALEGLRLAPDPVSRRLVPVTSLFMSLVPS